MPTPYDPFAAVLGRGRGRGRGDVAEETPGVAGRARLQKVAVTLQRINLAWISDGADPSSELPFAADVTSITTDIIDMSSSWAHTKAVSAILTEAKHAGLNIKGHSVNAWTRSFIISCR